MKSAMRLLAPLFLIASLHAQNRLSKYAVLPASDKETYLTSLNQLADEGYRVLFTGKYTILRMEATPPDTYRYLRIEGEGGFVQFTNWINEQGAHGYRWRPREGLMEKAPHPRNYEYRASHHGGLGPSKGSDISPLLEAGYRPLGIAGFRHAISANTVELYFEREIGQPAGEPPQSPGDAVEIADAMRAGNVLKHVDELAKRGYRFLGTALSNKGGGIAAMMEKCPGDCAGRYEYRYFDAKNAAQVSSDLNTLGSDGFRVLPVMLGTRPHLLERDTQDPRKFMYRILQPTDATSLQQALGSADQEGYAPIGYVWHMGWTVQGFLVLEKETTASSPPAPSQ